MTTTDAHRWSDSYVSTGDLYNEATSDNLPPGSKGVRGAIVAINVMMCIAGKLKYMQPVVPGVAASMINCIDYLGIILLTWFNFNPNMDK